MKAVKTAHSNHNFGPPPNVTDGSIGDLPCQNTVQDGYRVVRSIWEPSDDERKAIAAGANLELDVVWIGAFPPVALNVTDEKALTWLQRCDPEVGRHYHGSGDHCECGARANVVPGPALRGPKPMPDGGRIHG